MNALTLNICGVCDKTQIFKRDERGRLYPTDDYCEFVMHLSDKTVARHGICKHCINILDDHKVKAVFERIKQSWIDSMVGWASDKQFQQVREKEVWSWGLQEHEVIESFKAVNEEKRVEKLEKETQEKIKQRQKEKDKDAIK